MTNSFISDSARYSRIDAHQNVPYGSIAALMSVFGAGSSRRHMLLEETCYCIELPINLDLQKFSEVNTIRHEGTSHFDF